MQPNTALLSTQASSSHEGGLYWGLEDPRFVWHTTSFTGFTGSRPTSCSFSLKHQSSTHIGAAVGQGPLTRDLTSSQINTGYFPGILVSKRFVSLHAFQLRRNYAKPEILVYTQHLIDYTIDYAITGVFVLLINVLLLTQHYTLYIWTALTSNFLYLPDPPNSFLHCKAYNFVFTSHTNSHVFRAWSMCESHSTSPFLLLRPENILIFSVKLCAFLGLFYDFSCPFHALLVKFTTQELCYQGLAQTCLAFSLE